MNLNPGLLLYLLFINVIAFGLMGLDKWKARRGKWRIPEKTLFLAALLGGSVGSILGMQLFRHKTKHTAFKVGMPCILLIQLLLYYYVFVYLGVMLL